MAQGWQQIPRSRIIASFAHVGVMSTTETGAAVTPDDRIDDKLDAQIQVLLKVTVLVTWVLEVPLMVYLDEWAS